MDSRVSPKRFAKNVFSIFMKIWPPSDSNAYNASACCSLSTVSVR